MAVVMLIFWFAFAQIRWLIVLVSSIMLGLFISHLFIAFVNNLAQRQYAFLNRQLRVHLDIPETDMFSFRWVYPSLQGKYLSRRIQIYTTTQAVGGREREAPFTTVSVDASFGGRSFSIRPEALGKRFTKFFYNKKRITEERSFDRKFDVNGDDLKYVGGLLDGAVRDILNQGILSRESYLEFNNGKFSYTEQTVINTSWERRRFEKIILVMYMIAKKMEQGGRPKPLPERKPKDVLPPELSELLEEEYTPEKRGKQSEIDFDMNMDGLDSDMDFEDEDLLDFPDEEELDKPSRRLENEIEGTRQLDLFEETGFPSSRKLNTSDEDLFRDGVEDGGKLSEEGIDKKKETKKEDKKKKDKAADQPKKEEKQKPKPAPKEEPVESLDLGDFDLNFGTGDEDLSGLDIDLDNLDDMDFDENDLGDLDDMDFDMNDLDGMDLGDMDFDDSDFDMDGFDDLDDMDFDDLFKK